MKQKLMIFIISNCCGDNTMAQDHEDVMMCFNYTDICICTNLPLLLQRMDIESYDSIHTWWYSLTL